MILPAERPRILHHVEVDDDFDPEPVAVWHRLDGTCPCQPIVARTTPIDSEPVIVHRDVVQ